MVAIITKNFRQFNAQNLIDSIVDSNDNFFVSFGKTSQWEVEGYDPDTFIPDPEDNLSGINDAWKDAISMKKIDGSNISFVVPRYDWKSGEIFIGYNDNSESLTLQRFYCVTSNLNVYKCIEAPAINSQNVPNSSKIGVVNEPTSLSTDSIIDTNDGYKWKYMYTVLGSDAVGFLSNNYVPVKVLDPNDYSTTPDDEKPLQLKVQEDAVDGSIMSYEIINGGTGYLPNESNQSGTIPLYDENSPQTTYFKLDGDGTGVNAELVVTNGTITGVNFIGNFSTAIGSDYNFANISVVDGDRSGGVEAEINPIISPKGGHGSNAVKELNAYYLMISMKFEGDEVGELITDNDFRQIMFVRNPTKGGSLVTTEIVNSAQTLNLSSHSGFSPDDIIKSNTTNAKALVISYDSATGKIVYVQNDTTGYTQFTANDTIVVDGGTGSESGVVDANNPLTDREVDLYTGDVLFIENRAKVLRNPDQTENLKIVLVF